MVILYLFIDFDQPHYLIEIVGIDYLHIVYSSTVKHSIYVKRYLGN